MDRNFYFEVILLSAEADDIVEENLFALVEVPDELLETALVVEGLLLVRAQIVHLDPNSPVEEGQLTDSCLKDLVVQLGCFEDLIVGPNRHLGPRQLSVPNGLDRCHRDSPTVFLDPDLSVPHHFHGELVGKGVDNGDAYAVKTTGDLVSLLIELPAGMEDRQDDLKGASALLGVDVHRDSPSVVFNGEAVVFVKG